VRGGILAGSPGSDECTSGIPGSAFFMNKKGISLTYQSPNIGMSDGFGSAFYSGKTFDIVGAPGFDEFNFYNSGRVYVYLKKSVSPFWIIENIYPFPDNQFGAAVAAVGDRFIVVGAPNDKQHQIKSGTVHYFRIPSP